MKFTHLHCHTHYSLLDGLPRVPQMVTKAKELGMDAIAITDHGVMYGVIEFYQSAIKAGIKPIIGIEAYMAPHKLTQKRPRIDDQYYHLILLAKNREGYRHLMEMTSIAHTAGFYYKPRIDKELLAEKKDGLIATSGCLGGELCELLKKGDIASAKENIAWYVRLMGDENFYIEVQEHPEIPEQVNANKLLIELANEMGVPIVLTQDFHYLDPQDAEAQDVLLCINSGKTIDDKDRLCMMDMNLHMISGQEISEKWGGPPEAIENTRIITDKCNVEIELNKWHFPSVEISSGKSAEEELRDQAYEGARKKYGELSSQIRERLDYELDVIVKKNYASYILSVADFVQYAKNKGIVTTTRGSAAGSLVSYCLRITNVDPLIYNLPFERFLNPYRPSAPDIDMDFADDRRHEMIEYVIRKYGKEKVAQICTFGTMAARGSVRDVGRVLGYPYSFCDKVAKLIPFGSQGFPMTISRALEITPELKSMYDEDSRIKRLLDLAQKVEGCARHASVHAAGVVIAPTKLTDFTPIQKESGGENIITQYEMKSVESVGLIKYDFLGIRNLSILGNAVHLVKKIKNVDIDLENIPLDDSKTFELLSQGNTTGLFQLNGAGITRYLKELCPTNINDIMAMVALYRPGPMEFIPEYISRKKDPSKVRYLDPRLEEILKGSFGIITYQDDVLLIAIKLAGYNWEEVDKFRKAIGKKIPEEMEKQKSKFINGCKKNGLSDAKIKELWSQIETFSAYGFNKAHAASYGMVAYQTAYMKANFPTEYMTAILTAESHDLEKVAEIVRECNNMGIQVLPPSVNESFEQFTYVDENTIRFGLLAIKNVGHGIVTAIIEEREKNGKYQDLSDFLTRVRSKDLNKKSLESLIKCGTMDEFEERGRMLANIEQILSFIRNVQKENQSNQASLFSVLEGESSRPKIFLRSTPEAPVRQKLAWEKELIGLYVSEHPFQEFQPYLENNITPVGKLRSYIGQETIIAGIVSTIKKVITRSGDPMLFVTIEDTTHMTELLVFPKILAETADLWDSEKALLVQGKVSDKDNEIKILVQKVEEITMQKAKHSIWDVINISQNKPKDHMPKKSHFLFVKYSPDEDGSRAQKLKELFSCFPGKYRVYFVLDKDGKQQKIKTPYQVDVNPEMESKIVELIGAQNYKIMTV